MQLEDENFVPINSSTYFQDEPIMHLNASFGNTVLKTFWYFLAKR
jgi:hypothetical protein